MASLLKDVVVGEIQVKSGDPYTQALGYRYRFSNPKLESLAVELTDLGVKWGVSVPGVGTRYTTDNILIIDYDCLNERSDFLSEYASLVWNIAVAWTCLTYPDVDKEDIDKVKQIFLSIAPACGVDMRDLMQLVDFTPE